jgi:hypothetical protein
VVPCAALPGHSALLTAVGEAEERVDLPPLLAARKSMGSGQIFTPPAAAVLVQGNV